MRRGDWVTVQGPAKKQQPDGMSHKGGGGWCMPKHPSLFYNLLAAYLRLTYSQPTSDIKCADEDQRCPSAMTGTAPGSPPPMPCTLTFPKTSHIYIHQRHSRHSSTSPCQANRQLQSGQLVADLAQDTCGLVKSLMHVTHPRCPHFCR